ncbi:MAG TPA: hypothetical protein VNA21_03755 [Steroidobacteraceae bacterium]|nr:hypothetical protein [Steroidobacteraceae bacterium]
MKTLGRRGRRGAASLSLIGATALIAPATGSAQVTVNPDLAALAKMPVIDSSSLRAVVANLAGRSGKLLARFVAPPRSIGIPAIAGNLNYTTKAIPAVQEVAGASRLGRFSVITMRSFRDKIAGSVGNYRIGFFPEERGRATSEAYENPEGFIEVTRENQDTRISQHFRLRDFLTHDQAEVWPKYLVLREPLIDKLELVIQELEDDGIPVRNVKVLSGFRTPQYNLGLGDGSGRARDSRHQFGDAADIYIDSNNNDRMDDLNGDGRVNVRDTRVILAAVERVEKKYPDLVGGTGLYHATGAHGPFAHIDVRGSRARWSTGSRMASSKRYMKGSRRGKGSKRAKGKKVASSRRTVSKKSE